MSSENIEIRKKIKATSAYNSLNKIMKNITCKRNNVLKISQGVSVAKHIGLEEWEEKHNFNWSNTLIVKEIVENGCKKNS